MKIKNDSTASSVYNYIEDSNNSGPNRNKDSTNGLSIGMHRYIVRRSKRKCEYVSCINSDIMNVHLLDTKTENSNARSFLCNTGNVYDKTLLIASCIELRYTDFQIPIDKV